ncbi:hypothetical protein BFW38_06970 [Terasakiispira papahanaumokuakeensis]|uniref:ABC transmembrane type-2 domain-containing protein n=1 Tax=Terasakiispira papahanaumokuakeensis TaxID=197479 RepID=A0A1E2V8J8_9GAMM|nr:ABC transporter permease [Terasakiispira papahanaumokuakeensis]ODC03329.1 hypothetical protein BFW38_06970 [Terasakiispira papahanaumokuakeensis]
MQSPIAWRRLIAMCRKESYQILRDPSSAMIAVVIPLLLLFIFGYGINLDSGVIRLGIVAESHNADTHALIQAFDDSPYIEPIVADHRAPLVQQLEANQIRGLVIIPTDFSDRLNRDEIAPLQVITDGSEPNTAQFLQQYVQGAWEVWLTQKQYRLGVKEARPIEVEMRVWYNPAAISQYFIIPGAISIIMTVIGAILTSLVIAREWERGTMEAILATRVTRTELLLSKLLPYYVLGMFAMLLCVALSTGIMGVPLRGSFLLLIVVSLLFLTSSMGMGLLISTITRNQFNAAMMALNAAFLPAVMLSGFVFEIGSMPHLVQWVSQLVPARYFVSILKTLFLAGNLTPIILINSLYLLITAFIFIGLTAFKTSRQLA